LPKRRRRASTAKQPLVEYRDPEGNLLRLRPVMSAATRSAYRTIEPVGADRPEDADARRREFLFERLAASWEIAGLEPITKQAELLARYRISSGGERAWVDSTVGRHVSEHFPELDR
jgi:hypothetical protein